MLTDEEKSVNTYFDRLTAAFAIAGLLVMAPLFAMAKTPTPANAHYPDPTAKKRPAVRTAKPLLLADKSETT
jgi:hypothetical protein